MLLGMMVFCACSPRELTEEERRNGSYQVMYKHFPQIAKYNVYVDTLYVFRVQDITKYNSDYTGDIVDFGIVETFGVSGSTDKQARNLCLVTDKYGNLQEMELNYNTEVGDTLVKKCCSFKVEIINLTLQNKAKAFLKQR